MLAISCAQPFAGSLVSSHDDTWAGTDCCTPDLADCRGVFLQQHRVASLGDSERALALSQRGSLVSVPFALSTAPGASIRSRDLRRLRLPLLLCLRSCRCGRPLNVFGHHRAAPTRGFWGEGDGLSSQQRREYVVREAGARVRTNIIRDMDLGYARHPRRDAKC